LWNYKVGNNEFRIFGDTTWVHEWNIIAPIFISADGKYIIAIDDIYAGQEPHIIPRNSRILFLNNKGELLWDYYTTKGIITSVDITPDGRYIAIGTGYPPSSDYEDYNISENVCLFNNKGELLWSYKEHYIGGKVESVSISPDGKYIAGGFDNGNVFVFNNKGDILWSFKLRSFSHYTLWDPELKRFRNYSLCSEPVCNVDITPDGRYILINSLDKIYLLNTGLNVNKCINSIAYIICVIILSGILILIISIKRNKKQRK
jgi:WD40 repeat protein